MNNLEKRVEKAITLYKSTPTGVGIKDADTVLADIMLNEDKDYEVIGLGLEALIMWQRTTDRETFEDLFHMLADIQFKDFVNMCIYSTTKSEDSHEHDS